MLLLHALFTVQPPAAEHTMTHTGTPVSSDCEKLAVVAAARAGAGGVTVAVMAAVDAVDAGWRLACRVPARSPLVARRHHHHHMAAVVRGSLTGALLHLEHGVADTDGVGGGGHAAAALGSISLKELLIKRLNYRCDATLVSLLGDPPASRRCAHRRWRCRSVWWRMGAALLGSVEAVRFDVQLRWPRSAEHESSVVAFVSLAAAWRV